MTEKKDNIVKAEVLGSGLSWICPYCDEMQGASFGMILDKFVDEYNFVFPCHCGKIVAIRIDTPFDELSKSNSMSSSVIISD